MTDKKAALINEELDILIRSRYPIIYIVSYEEKRIENLLINIAKQRNKKIMSWSITTGMINLLSTGSPQVNEATRDPESALDHIHRGSDYTLYLIKDFHHYLTTPSVIRRLRDLTIQLRTSYKTLILVSPILRIPQELEKEITVIDYPLPQINDLGELFDSFVFSMQTNKNIKINLSSGAKERMLQAALGLTLAEAENVFAKVIVTHNRIDPEDIPIILLEKKQIVRKSGLLEYYSASENVDDIGGLSNLKEWLNKRALAFSNKAREYGLPPPKGILLLGVSGSGKSLVAKVVSSVWNLPLLRFDVGSVFSGLVGSSEENMRKAIKIAESVSPCLLWLDEIDKSLSGSSSSNFSDAGTTARVLSTFLTWMQEKQSPVFVIATANNVNSLPPEILRKGRLDEIFFLDLPNQKEREEIFRIHLKKRNRNPENFDMGLLSSLANGFSGAEIEQAIISALYDSFEKDRELITPDIVNSIRQSVPLSHTMKESIDNLRQWAQTRARPASGEQSILLPDE